LRSGEHVQRANAPAISVELCEAERVRPPDAARAARPDARAVLREAVNMSGGPTPPRGGRAARRANMPTGPTPPDRCRAAPSLL